MPRFQLITIGLIAGVFIVFLVIVLILMGVIPGLKPRPLPKAELEFWGVFDEPEAWESLIGEFNRIERFKHITINYSQKPVDEYEDELINSLAAKNGPDIFMIHNNWLPKHQDKLSFMPQGEEWINDREFQMTFVDVAYDDFVRERRIYAIPLYIDTLGLYYNKDVFNTVGIAQPPKSWEEFTGVVKKTKIIDEKGNIQRAGAAIGTVENINRATDILALMFLQKGNPIIDLKDKNILLTQEDAHEILKFYTSFADPKSSNYTWDSGQDYSIDDFYQGEAVMMLNYSHHIPTIKTKSPYLNFEVVGAPKFEGQEKDINYANYWGLAVSKDSEDIKIAWEFIKWISQKENIQNYLAKTQKPTPIRDLIFWQESAFPQLGVFSKQTLSAKSWYKIDDRRVEKIFRDMVELVVAGELTIEQSLRKAEDEMKVLLK